MRDWRDDAACLGYDPEGWWPVGQSHSPPNAGRVAAAKAICRRCPSQNPCLTWALENGEHGIWGGMTEEERLILLGREDWLARAEVVTHG